MSWPRDCCAPALLSVSSHDCVGERIPSAHGAAQRTGEALRIHTSARSAWSHRDIYGSSFEAKLFAEFPTEGKFSSWLLSTRTGQAVPEKLFVRGRRTLPTPIAAMEAEELQMPPQQAGLSPAVVLPPPLVPLSHCAERECWLWAGQSHGVQTAAPSPAQQHTHPHAHLTQQKMPCRSNL